MEARDFRRIGRVALMLIEQRGCAIQRSPRRILAYFKPPAVRYAA